MNIPARCAFFLLLAASLSPAAHAQGYPSKPVRIIVAGPLGGPSDMPARGVGHFLSMHFNQSFVIDNRAGANGILGAEACAKAAGDGYTLCLLNSTVISLNPFWYRKLPYDPREFVPIAHLGTTNTAWVVHASVPASSARELLALAKAKPGAYTWGTFGQASNSHLYLEWLKKTQGIEFLNVPYKTNAQALTALAAGEVQVGFGAVGTVSDLSKTGKIRILAVASSDRSPYLSDTPLLKESGIDYESGTWAGLFAPPGTPASIAQSLNTEIAKLFDNAQFRTKFLGAVGLEQGTVGGKPVPQFAAFLKTSRDKAAKLAKDLDVRPE